MIYNVLYGSSVGDHLYIRHGWLCDTLIDDKDWGGVDHVIFHGHDRRRNTEACTRCDDIKIINSE